MSKLKKRLLGKTKLINILLFSSVCIFFAATGSRFYPLFIIFFLSAFVLWLMGCKGGDSIALRMNTLFAGRKDRKRSRFDATLYKIDTVVVKIAFRLLPLGVLTGIVGSNLIRMGRVHASAWEGVMLIVAIFLGIATGEKIQREIKWPRSKLPLLMKKPAEKPVNLEEHFETIEHILPDLDELKDALRSPDKITRIWAIDELKRMGNEDARDILKSLLNDEDNEIKALAKEAMESVGN